MIIICEGRGSRDSEQNKKQMRLLQIFFGHAGDREVLKPFTPTKYSGTLLLETT